MLQEGIASAADIDKALKLGLNHPMGPVSYTHLDVYKRQLHETALGLGATFLRVNLALLLGALWTVPAGVAIGLNPRLARIAHCLLYTSRCV